MQKRLGYKGGISIVGGGIDGGMKGLDGMGIDGSGDLEEVYVSPTSG